MRTNALDYDLPERLIATSPAEPRDSARLMVIHRETEQIEHRWVRDLPELDIFRDGDLMLVNQTAVLPAYLEGVRESTGGRVTGLYLGSADATHWDVLFETRGRLTPGERVVLDTVASLELIEKGERGRWRVRLEADQPTPRVLERVGQTPLPPYIRRQRRKLGLAEVGASDQQRYNTVYAEQGGSVAAPTAGLHFTPQLLGRLQALGMGRAAVDLHVGMGTFEPVRSEALQDHAMHEETFSVSRPTLAQIADCRARGGRILAVGTTTVRAIESLPADVLAEHNATHDRGYAGSTRLFIHPEAGFTFRYTDCLMTNFHLPRSTLLALVASLPGVGLDRLQAWYREAVERGYRFYSYGDAMLLV
ncbi:MAG: tRNA preQ1(34) S-adenosylmethionine ribosyltransferase-isomerase QueA [Planctomycetota bacterium]